MWILTSQKHSTKCQKSMAIGFTLNNHNPKPTSLLPSYFHINIHLYPILVFTLNLSGFFLVCEVFLWHINNKYYILYDTSTTNNKFCRTLHEQIIIFSRMPAYDESNWFAFFFIIYTIICLYIFMSIVLAAIYYNYRNNLKVRLYLYLVEYLFLKLKLKNKMQ